MLQRETIFMHQKFNQEHIKIPFYCNLQALELGMDSRAYSTNRHVFDLCPAVTYQFNDAGFRTHPSSAWNADAILVLGDSFTLGLGVNASDRYTDIIEKQLSRQVLNFSLNGASNDWIARKLRQLLTIFQPSAIVIHYTFSHRRERPNLDWADDERTECEPFYSVQENFDNWMRNFRIICDIAGSTKIVHSFIPNWHIDSIEYSDLGNNIIAPLAKLDRARDNFHYGPMAHAALAELITNLLDF
jgi:hypothetical protein